MKLLALLIVFIAGITFSCALSDQVSSGEKPSLTPNAESPTPTPFETLSLAKVKTAFEKADLPMSKITVYDADSDPNELLGRPNQYIEKMNFADTRKRMGPDCTVEVFRIKRICLPERDTLIQL